MRIAIGILLLAVGVSYPIGAVFWLNRRMTRQPVPEPRLMGRILTLNLIFPVCLVLAGIGFLVPRLGDSIELQMGAGLAALVAFALLIQVLIDSWRAGRTAGREPGEPGSQNGG
jgi:hypothetical protein